MVQKVLSCLMTPYPNFENPPNTQHLASRLEQKRWDKQGWLSSIIQYYQVLCSDKSSITNN